MQALYSYYNDGKESVSQRHLINAMEKNVSKLYELYLYLLLFLEELGNFSKQYEEETRSRYIVNEKDATSSGRLNDNIIIQRLINSKALHKAASKYFVEWDGDQDILRRVFLDLKNQEAYKEYVSFGEQKRVLEQEVIIFILKHYTSNLALFQQHLEEHFYNWLDDKKIALQMTIKTVQTIASEPDAEDFLIPLSANDDENYEYARELLKKTIEHDERIQELIAGKVSKWEAHQIALIDNIIIKMAVCEFLYFPSIPVKVTINEYIELAKNYSTPQSKRFVNGVLDAILKDLKKDSKFIKG